MITEGGVFDSVMYWIFRRFYCDLVMMFYLLIIIHLIKIRFSSDLDPNLIISIQ